MAKKVSKKKTAKKASKKAAAAKKAVTKVAKKVSSKKAATKNPAQKPTVKKAAKKTATEKGTVEKAPTKDAKKPTIKKASIKKAVVKKSVQKKAVVAKVDSPKLKVAKKAAKRAPRKSAKDEDLPPVIVKRRYVRPEIVAKLSGFEKKQRQRLLDLRDQITDSMYGIQSETIKNGNEGSDSSGSGMHQGDAGSDAYDRDFALTMLSKEANALGEIEQALQRLELGTYGICEQSGAKIPHPRLEAMPFARLTVECQAAKEREESSRDYSAKEYGFN